MSRADPNAPIIVGHAPGPRRPDRIKNNGLDRSNAVFTLNKDGRAHMRGHTHRRSEARKIVPKRRFDTKTPHGLLKRHAYTMDITRKQMAAALGVAVPTFDAIIGYRGHRLKPWMVKALTPVLALTEADVAAIHAAGVERLGWEPQA